MADEVAKIDANNKPVITAVTDISQEIRMLRMDDATKGLKVTVVGGSISGVTLETNGVTNGSQTLLNLVEGTNMNITDDGLGNITFDASGGGGAVDSVNGETGIVVLTTDDISDAGQTNLYSQWDNIITPEVGITYTGGIVQIDGVGIEHAFYIGDFSGTENYLMGGYDNFGGEIGFQIVANGGAISNFISHAGTPLDWIGIGGAEPVSPAITIFDATKNIGINTTTDDGSRFHVVGTSAFNGQVFVTPGSGDGLYFFESGTNEILGSSNGDQILVSYDVDIDQYNYANGALIFDTTTATFSDLAGTGTRMVIASSTGELSTQVITTGTVTSVSGSGGSTGMSLNGGPITSTGTLTLSGTLNLASGGLGSSLSDPGANKILAWDDTDNTNGYWTLNADTFTYTHATHTLAATPLLNYIGGATATNTIDSFNNTQTWAWNSLTAATGMVFTSPSTQAASNTQKLAAFSLTGGNSNANQTTTVASFSNTHTGTNATNICTTFNASGGATNTAVQVIAGNVLIVNNGTSALLGLGIPGTTAGTIDLAAATSGNLILSPAASTTPYTFKFPADAGTSTYVLQTDGSGNTSWVSPGGGGTTPGGGEGDIQFNTSSAFNGSSDFNWDNSGKILAITGSQTITAGSADALTITSDSATAVNLIGNSLTGIALTSGGVGNNEEGLYEMGTATAIATYTFRDDIGPSETAYIYANRGILVYPSTGITTIANSTAIGFDFTSGAGDAWTVPIDKGTDGQFLKSNGDGTTEWDAATATIAIGSPITSGTPDRVLYIDASGDLAQSDEFLFEDTIATLTLGSDSGNNGICKFVASDGGTVSITVAPTDTPTSWTMTLPVNTGTAGYYLQDTDGAGTTSWEPIPPPVITIGSTTVSGGANTRILYNNSGLVGEYTISGSGNVAMTTSPVFTTPNIGSATGSVSGNAGTATTLQTGRTIGTATGDVTSAGSSFNGSANNTNAYTLATVNSNVGSFGSATQVGGFTVNAKGLITAASNTTITPAVGSITGLGTGIATWLATPSSANLAAAVTDETGTGALVFGTSPDFTTGATIGSVAIPTISSTNTLTNKRITKRVVTVNAPGATPTTNTDNCDIAEFTGLATAITSMTTNISGTPVNGDLMEYMFLDNGTARAIAWGSSFADGGIFALPTTTVISVMLRVLVQYQTTASLNKWVCVGIA